MAERQTISMGHARRYQEEQPELAIWCLLYNVFVSPLTPVC